MRRREQVHDRSDPDDGDDIVQDQGHIRVRMDMMSR